MYCDIAIVYQQVIEHMLFLIKMPRLKIYSCFSETIRLVTLFI